MQELYLTDITPAEATAGFVVSEIEAPKPHYAGYPTTIRAVVYLKGSYRLIKLRHPSGRGYYYNLEGYGVRQFPEFPNRHQEPEWIPLDSQYQEEDPNRVT